MKDSEYREYAITHIERDMALNRKLSRIDFSQFFAEVFPICTGHLYLHQEQRENLQGTFPLRMIGAQTDIGKEIGKTVMFNEASKAGVAIIQIYDEKELRKIDDYLENLARNANPVFREINGKTLQYFIQ